ncbi:hypothetical protein BV898_12695 [Hypsibius exemplaris]|uniref:Uncharacterized protein n=1 Tax=Hypsibius exemplaris TaxID=2072580 RepID=A0A1W0WCZ3_HYPEX|nr:hypothetical protein BV898_12695 [Hypsibius exemplaris]
MSLTIDRDAFEDIMRTMRELKVCLDNKIAENRKNDTLHKNEIRNLTSQLAAVRSESFNSRGDSEPDPVRNARLLNENQSLRKELLQLKSDREQSSHQERLTLLLKAQIDQLRDTNSALQSDLKRTQDLQRTQSKEIDTLVHLKNSQTEFQTGHERYLQETNSRLEVDNCQLQLRLREQEGQLRSLEKTKSEYESLKLKSVQLEQDVVDLKSTLSAAKSESENHEQRVAKKVEVLEREREGLQKEKENVTETLTADCKKIASEKAALQGEVQRLANKLKVRKEIKYENERLRQLSEKQSNELIELRDRKNELSTMVQTQETLAKTAESEKARLAKRVKSLKKSVSKLQTDVSQCESVLTENDQLKAEVAHLHALMDRQALVLRKDQHTFFDEIDSTLSVPRQSMTASSPALLQQQQPQPKSVSDSENQSFGTPADLSDIEGEDSRACPTGKESLETDSWFALLEKRRSKLLDCPSVAASEPEDEEQPSNDSLLARKCQNHLGKRKSLTQRDRESKDRHDVEQFQSTATSTPSARSLKGSRKDVPKPVVNFKAVDHLRNTYTPVLKVLSPRKVTTGRGAGCADSPVLTRPPKSRDNR